MHLIFPCQMSFYSFISWNFADKREAWPKRCPCWADWAITSCQNLVWSTEKLLLELRRLPRFHCRLNIVQRTRDSWTCWGSHFLVRKETSLICWDSKKILALKLLALLYSGKWEKGFYSRAFTECRWAQLWIWQTSVDLDFVWSFFFF